MAPIKLFDVQSTLNPPAWSQNSWRIRLVLNYKRLPHETQWVAYPHIPNVLSGAGIPCTRKEWPTWNVPAIIDESEGKRTVRMSDTLFVADHLEDAYPEPTIYPGGRDLQISYADQITKNFMAHAAFIVIPSATRILDARDREHFVTSRKMLFGTAVKDMFPQEKQEEMWATLEKGLDELAAFIDGLKPVGQWPFGDAAGPGWADFVLGSCFIWFRLAGPEGGWDRIKGRNGARWERLHDNFKPYMEVH